MSKAVKLGDLGDHMITTNLAKYCTRYHGIYVRSFN